jgi:hypothetical protein
MRGQHPKAPDRTGILASKMEQNAEPDVLMQRILQEKEQLRRALEQERKTNEGLIQENSDLNKRIEKVEPFEHILQDTRAFLTIYLRKSMLIQKFRMKAEMKYNKLANIDQDSDSGRKIAHRCLDHVAEVCIEHCLNQWHLIEAKLEDDASANFV